MRAVLGRPEEIAKLTWLRGNAIASLNDTISEPGLWVLSSHLASPMGLRMCLLYHAISRSSRGFYVCV
jgi:hypothetical protein